jgi:ABC-type branched-subunit amino acid transport system ATPase component
VIEVRKLTKSFGPRTALAGVDLSIGEGEFVTLVGPNGAGKTSHTGHFEPSQLRNRPDWRTGHQS